MKTIFNKQTLGFTVIISMVILLYGLLHVTNNVINKNVCLTECVIELFITAIDSGNVICTQEYDWSPKLFKLETNSMYILLKQDDGISNVTIDFYKTDTTITPDSIIYKQKNKYSEAQAIAYAYAKKGDLDSYRTYMWHADLIRRYIPDKYIIKKNQLGSVTLKGNHHRIIKRKIKQRYKLQLKQSLENKINNLNNKICE
jgi:hypothetical protein